jgi:hypothetical protein
MLRQWFKRSFDKLDLLGDYFRAAYPQWHEILWGASVPAVIFFLAWSLGLPKNWAVVLWFIVAWSLAGYYVWRAVHVRFIPKLKIAEARFQDTPVTLGGAIVDNRTFIQLVFLLTLLQPTIRQAISTVRMSRQIFARFMPVLCGSTSTAVNRRQHVLTAGH